MPLTRWTLKWAGTLLVTILVAVSVVVIVGLVWVETGPLLAYTDSDAPGVYLLDTGRNLPYPVARNAGQPQWSDDGDTLQFIGIQNAELGCEICDFSMASKQITPGRAASAIDFELPLGTWRIIRSPDGRYLSYVRNDLNYLHDMEQGRVFPLPSVADVGLVMDWSPGGRALLFYDEFDRTFALMDMPNRENLRRYGELAVIDYPIWSPDGEWLAFSGSVYGVDWSDLYIAQSRVTDGENVTATRVTHWGNSYQSSAQAWSPDGQALLYQRQRFDATDVLVEIQSRILTIDAATGSVLEDYPLSVHGDDAAWSHDGMWIVFRKENDLHRIRRDGSDLQRLTFTPDTEEMAYWRP